MFFPRRRRPRSVIKLSYASHCEAWKEITCRWMWPFTHLSTWRLKKIHNNLFSRFFNFPPFTRYIQLRICAHHTFNSGEEDDGHGTLELMMMMMVSRRRESVNTTGDKLNRWNGRRAGAEADEKVLDNKTKYNFTWPFHWIFILGARLIPIPVASLNWSRQWPQLAPASMSVGGGNPFVMVPRSSI